MGNAERRRAREILSRALHPLSGDLSGLSDVDPEAWIEEAEWGGVAPLMAEILSREGLVESLERGVADRLRRILLDAEMAAAQLDEAFRLAHDALENLGVRYIALKGAALARLVYPRPSLRPMSDIDLLIDPTRVDEVLEALSEQGFKLPKARSLELSRHASKCVPVKPPLELDIEIELHWSIAQEGRNSVEVPRLFDDAQSLDIAGRSSQALGKLDLLLHQSLHHSYHAFEPKLSWLLDLALLHEDPPPLQSTLSRAREWGMQTALALSVNHLEKVFRGVCDPSYVAWAAEHPRARTILCMASDDDPLGLLKGWRSSRTQLLLKLATLDSGRAFRWQVRAWGERLIRFGGGRARAPSGTRAPDR